MPTKILEEFVTTILFVSISVKKILRLAYPKSHIFSIYKSLFWSDCQFTFRSLKHKTFAIMCKFLDEELLIHNAIHN